MDEYHILVFITKKLFLILVSPLMVLKWLYSEAKVMTIVRVKTFRDIFLIFTQILRIGH